MRGARSRFTRHWAMPCRRRPSAAFRCRCSMVSIVLFRLWSASGRLRRLLSPTGLEPSGVGHLPASAPDGIDIVHGGNVLGRVAVHDEKIGTLSRSDDAAVVKMKERGCILRGGLDCL